MKRLALQLVLLTALVLSLSACGSKPDVEAVAQCMADRASPDQAWRYGTQLATGGSLLVGRWDSLGCDGGWAVAADRTARANLAEAMPKLLVLSPDFRGGAYAAFLSPASRPEHRRAMAELGLKLEDFASTRDRAFNCLKADESVLRVLAEPDESFATAVAGFRAGVGAPEVAHSIAQELVKRAASAALVAHPQNCDGDVQAEYKAYGAEVASFLDGKHPWAPGCKAVADREGMSLTCTGQGPGAEADQGTTP